MAATFDAPERCVPGFVYISQLAALSTFTEYAAKIAQSQSRYNDMSLLAGFYLEYGPQMIDNLPLITPGYPLPLQNRLGCRPKNPEFYRRHFIDFNSIFDAAAIGQFLGGVDPANSPNQSTIGFINETTIFDPSLYEYRWSKDGQGRRVPVIVERTGVYKINNLHIHSKQLDFFRSDESK
jgi:hypothetical protein